MQTARSCSGLVDPQNGMGLPLGFRPAKCSVFLSWPHENCSTYRIGNEAYNATKRVHAVANFRSGRTCEGIIDCQNVRQVHEIMSYRN
jgi:hypothetical protein